MRAASSSSERPRAAARTSRRASNVRSAIARIDLGRHHPNLTCDPGAAGSICVLCVTTVVKDHARPAPSGARSRPTARACSPDGPWRRIAGCPDAPPSWPRTGSNGPFPRARRRLGPPARRGALPRIRGARPSRRSPSSKSLAVSTASLDAVSLRCSSNGFRRGCRGDAALSAARAPRSAGGTGSSSRGASGHRGCPAQRTRGALGLAPKLGSACWPRCVGSDTASRPPTMRRDRPTARGTGEVVAADQPVGDVLREPRSPGADRR